VTIDRELKRCVSGFSDTACGESGKPGRGKLGFGKVGRRGGKIGRHIE